MFPPVSIVWPCSLSVDEYVAAGRQVEIPRPVCPTCSAAMTLWSGYRRQIRSLGRCFSIWVPRLRCDPCRATHALLPAFVLVNRLDVVETVGAVLDAVVGDGDGIRTAADRVDVPHTTARGWVRRFRARGRELAVAFAALATELGGVVITPVPDAGRHAAASVRAAWRAASALPGWLGCGRWRFVWSVSGGTLIATNTNSPYLIVGKRRFMPPVP